MREVEIEFQVEQARKALAGLYALCRLHQDVTGERAASLDEVRDYFEAQTPAPVDDPWGAAYWLEREGDILFLWSAGPDGMKGTSDDVSYTEDG